jgi:hypothetical protein
MMSGLPVQTLMSDSRDASTPPGPAETQPCKRRFRRWIARALRAIQENRTLRVRGARTTT